MKSYLSKKDRTDLIMLYSLLSSVETEFSRWFERKNITKQENTYLKTAGTYLKKMLDSIESRFDKNMVTQLIKDIQATEVFCLPKLEAKLKKESRTPQTIEVSKEALELLAEQALSICEGCNRDYTECELRDIYTELQLDPCDAEAEGYCQYKVR